MFKVASRLDPGSPFHRYLLEYDWETPAGATLFAEINHSDVLSEFMSSVSPVEKPRPWTSTEQLCSRFVQLQPGGHDGARVRPPVAIAG